MLPRNRSQASGARVPGTRAVAGVIAAGVLVGGVATLLLGEVGGGWEPASAVAQTSSTPAGAASRSGAAAKTTAATAAKPASGSVKPAAVSAGAKAAAAAPGAKVKAGSPGRAGAVVQSAAHLDDQVTYQYNALGRRDPFQSLLGGEYVGADVGGDAPPDVGGLKVVGIVWGDADQFALVEDARGDSHILRRGDKVMNGFVEVLKRDAMIVNLTLDGQSQSVRIPLTRKGDKSNANR